MKKKLLFLALMVALLACLFAISVSAETITYENEEIELVNNLGDPSWYTGNTALAIKDKESIVILRDSEGNKTAYPSYYILRFGVDVVDGAVTNAYVLWADQNGVDYSFVNENTGKSYESGSIYYIEFPYGMTKCMNNSIFGKDNDSKPESNVVEIVIPDSVTVIETQAFRRMNSCRRLTLSKNVKTLPDWSFCGSAALVEVVLPEGNLLETMGNSFNGCTALTTFNLNNARNLVSIGANAFYSTQLSLDLNLSGCTTLKSIGYTAFRGAKLTGLNLSNCTGLEYIDNYAFENVSTLAYADLSGTTSLESIGQSCFVGTSIANVTFEGSSIKTISSSAFSGCSTLRRITLCDSIETIGSQAFYKLGELTLASDYLPKNLKTIGTHFLSGCTLKNEVLYFPAGFTTFDSEYHFNDNFKPNTKLTLVFLGKMKSISIANSALTTWTNNGSKLPLTIILAQNSFDDLNGDFVQSVEYNGTQAYVSKHADGSAPYTTKTSGTLTITLCNNDPNTSSELGTDTNGNTICQADTAPAKIIFCGGDTVEYCYSVRNNYTDKGWYRFHTTKWTYDMDAHESTNVHYSSKEYQERNCGYDECTTYTCVICDLVNKVYTDNKATGEHTYEDDFNCETATVCETCKITLAEALVHDLVATIIYENGYIAQGVKTTTCSHKGCNTTETVDADVIFTFLGYSTKASETEKGITFGYDINREALADYESANGKLEFGTILTFSAKLGNNAPIVNGNVASIEGCNIIMPKLRDTVVASEINTIDCVLKGSAELWGTSNEALGNVTLENAKLILAGYTIDANGSTTYFGFSSTATAQELAYSYNDILAM